MPAYIIPIEHTRSFSLKPPDGLRYGNFEGVVHLPPALPSTRLGEHSFSDLNNQAIYKTVCEWYEGWRPWQQRVLLCGIVDRCSMRQVDMLATTLEPVRHRDYTVAAKHQYPSSPLKKLPDDPTKKKKKKKKGKKREMKRMKDERALNVGEPLRDAASPQSIIIDADNKMLTDEGREELRQKLTDSHQYKKRLSTIEQERTKEFTSVNKEYHDVDEYADILASRIIEESIPKTVSLFEPSELYAQDLASSILHQALGNVVSNMNEREKSIVRKTETTRLGEMEDTLKVAVPEKSASEIKLPEVNIMKPTPNETPRLVASKKENKEREKSMTKTMDTRTSKETIDLSILDKYKKFKPPPTSSQDNTQAKKKDGRPKSLVRILIPDDGEDDASGENKRVGSGRSGLSKAWSAVTRSSLSNMRYKLFGAHSLATPDYFREDWATRLEGGMMHLRQGGVRKPNGIHNVPVPVTRMYKSIKWWTEGPGEGKILLKAQKPELNANFKEQLQQVWDWMHLWEDFEKINLLKELLKLCGAEELNFLCGHLQQKLRDTRDVNRMSDKLLLYIFSYLSADEIHKVARVCRRWRYLCVTDSLWMVKCHELGLAEGIKNLEQMIVKAKGYRMVIDWRMAYEELQRITQMMKVGFMKKKAKAVKKGRTVEFREQIELLKKRDEVPNPTVNLPKIVRSAPKEKTSKLSNGSGSFSESFVSDTDSESCRPRFEFRNRITPRTEPKRGSIPRDELHSMIKRMLFEPEGAEKKPPSRGTPVIVELEVHRGTISAIRRQEKGQDDDAQSVVSEDLTHFDDEYKIQWDKIPERKPAKISRVPTRAVSTEGGVEILSKSEDRFDRIKRIQKGDMPAVGPSILRGRKKQMADEAAGDDAAYDIRPDLHTAPDILGKTKPHMSLQWHQEKKRPADSDDDEESSTSHGREPVFVGEVKSVLRARKLQGHMNGIMCVQYDRRRLLSAGLDRVIRMWDIRSGRSLHKFYGHKGGIRCLYFCGNELATGSWDTTIMVWDLRNLSRRFILTDHTDSVTCLTMNQDYMISGSQDCTVRVWRRNTYMCSNVIKGHKSAVNSVAFDGSHVISASNDMTLRLSNIITGDCIQVFTGGDDPIISVTMKGSLIISGDTAGRVHFWNKLTAECEAAIQAHSEAVNKVVFLEGRFYTASGDGTIREWDLVTMTSVRLLQGHRGPIRDIKVTSDRIVSCSDDGSIRIWDLFDPRKKTTMDEQLQQLHQDCP